MFQPVRLLLYIGASSDSPSSYMIYKSFELVSLPIQKVVNYCVETEHKRLWQHVRCKKALSSRKTTHATNWLLFRSSREGESFRRLTRFPGEQSNLCYPGVVLRGNTTTQTEESHGCGYINHHCLSMQGTHSKVDKNAPTTVSRTLTWTTRSTTMYDYRSTRLVSNADRRTSVRRNDVPRRQTAGTTAPDDSFSR